MSSPYPDTSTNLIYNLLFCDDLGRFKESMKEPHRYPWTILLSAHPSIADLQNILHNAELESRIHLLAAHALQKQGHASADKLLLGVVVEMGLENGLDVLASYRDGTARYINYTGRILIWDTKDESSFVITKQLFAVSEKIVAQIGPWNQSRRPAPSTGNLRISFLVTDGLYFGEGPIDTLFGDPMAGPALNAATHLLQYITSKS
jgi:hypothetical protein